MTDTTIRDQLIAEGIIKPRAPRLLTPNLGNTDGVVFRTDAAGIAAARRNRERNRDTFTNARTGFDDDLSPRPPRKRP